MKKSIVLPVLLSLFTAATVSASPALQAECNPSVDYFQQGTNQATDGNVELALASFDCAVQQRPTNAEAYNRRGRAHRDLGQFELALSDFSRAIELSPEIAAYHNNRGWAYYNLDNVSAALADYNQAITLDANYPYAYNNRGLIFVDLRRYEEALFDFDRAIALNYQPLDVPQSNRQTVLQLSGINPALLPEREPADVPVYTESMTAADSAYREGSFQAAVLAYTQAVTAAPDDYLAYFDRGQSYYALGDYDRALADFTQVIELVGLEGAPNAYGLRAQTYIQTGKFELALADLETVLEFDPHNDLALLQRSLIGNVTGQYETAEAAMEAWYGLWTLEELPVLENFESVEVEMTADHVFQIPFEGGVAQVVTVTARDVDANAVVDPYLVLLNPAGLPMVISDDVNGLNATVEYVLGEEGTYTLLVTHAGDGSEGLIEVSLMLVG